MGDEEEEVLTTIPEYLKSAISTYRVRRKPRIPLAGHLWLKYTEVQMPKKRLEDDDHDDEDEEEFDEAPTPKKSKKSTEATSEKPVFQLGSRKRVSISEFRGNLLVDIREFYTDRNDGVDKVVDGYIMLSLSDLLSAREEGYCADPGAVERPQGTGESTTTLCHSDKSRQCSTLGGRHRQSHPRGSGEEVLNEKVSHSVGLLEKPFFAVFIAIQYLFRQI